MAVPVEIDDDSWRRWLDDARRCVVCAAERVVYARRYGWDTPDDYERLQDAVDTLSALSHQWLTGQVPYATVGNTTEQPNTEGGCAVATPPTTPARSDRLHPR